MEGITRLVTESMARHGFETPLDYRRLRWSAWFRCDSSVSLLLAPPKPGVYALAEEVVPPGETPLAGGKRMLAIFQISEAEEIGLAMSRLFAPGSPLKERLESGRLFARYTVIEDPAQRHAAHSALLHWATTSAEVASGVASDLAVAPASSPEPVAPPVQNETKPLNDRRQIPSPSLFPAGF
jgi:hypothetical protein